MRRFTVLPLLVIVLLFSQCSPPAPAERVDALFAPYTGTDVPGASVLVVKDGVVRYKKSFGMANLEEGIPVTPATKFRLASVTKQFTAMAVLMLIDDGRLSLDTRLTDVFPDFPDYGGDITVRHLLSHTSGLVDYEDVIPAGTTQQLKDADVLALMRQQASTYFPPGTSYRYSNSGYAVLAMVVEALADVTFAQFLHNRIFAPIDMAGAVAFEEGVSTVPHRAYGYAEEEEVRFARNDQSITSAVLGDGGIYASVDDLYQWDRALEAGRLVKPGLLEQAFTPSPSTAHEGRAYGFGWFIGSYNGVGSMWHTGSTAGFRNAIERFPGRRLTVVVLSNRQEDVHTLLRHVADIYLEEE